MTLSIVILPDSWSLQTSWIFFTSKLYIVESLAFGKIFSTILETNTLIVGITYLCICIYQYAHTHALSCEHIHITMLAYILREKYPWIMSMIFKPSIKRMRHKSSKCNTSSLFWRILVHSTGRNIIHRFLCSPW